MWRYFNNQNQENKNAKSAKPISAEPKAKRSRCKPRRYGKAKPRPAKPGCERKAGTAFPQRRNRIVFARDCKKRGSAPFFIFKTAYRG